MPGSPAEPDDPLSFIQDCVRHRQVLWTYHVSMRLVSRNITRDAILAAVASYEVIERYPDDKYLPSYLVLARGKSDTFHILFATDASAPNVRVVTAYRPNPAEWEPTLKRRITP